MSRPGATAIRKVLPDGTIEKVMTGTERMAEIDHLLASDVHPALIAQELGVTPGAIVNSARRLDRQDIAAKFYAIDRAERDER